MNTYDDTSPTTSEIDSGFHVVNIVHLVIGVVLLGLLLTWALIVGGAVDDSSIRWLLPVPWVSAGFAGLVAIVVASRRRHQSPQEIR